MKGVGCTTAVILAAGAGTRLGDLGRRHSKPTVPTAGRPLIAWVIDSLRAAGIARVVVVGHPADDRLATLLRDTFPQVALVAQPKRHGIADALRHALPLVAEAAAYLACACDSLFLPDEIAALIALGRANAGTAAIAVLDMGLAATASRSAVRLSGDCVVEIIEKPAPGTTPSGLVAMPLYWLPRACAVYIDSVPPIGGESYISTALNAFVRAGGVVRAMPVSTRLEITTPDDIERAPAWLEQHGWARTRPGTAAG